MQWKTLLWRIKLYDKLIQSQATFGIRVFILQLKQLTRGLRLTALGLFEADLHQLRHSLAAVPSRDPHIGICMALLSHAFISKQLNRYPEHEY